MHSQQNAQQPDACHKPHANKWAAGAHLRGNWCLMCCCWMCAFSLMVKPLWSGNVAEGPAALSDSAKKSRWGWLTLTQQKHNENAAVLKTRQRRAAHRLIKGRIQPGRASFGNSAFYNTIQVIVWFFLLLSPFTWNDLFYCGNSQWDCGAIHSVVTETKLTVKAHFH